MKEPKRKNKENLIGKIIYGFLLFMPLLAILSTILVNTFNRENTQPTQEVEVTYKYETNEVNSVDDFVQGNIYTFNADYLENNRYIVCSYLYVEFYDADSELFKLSLEDYKYIILMRWANSSYTIEIDGYSTISISELVTPFVNFVYIEESFENFNVININSFSICQNIPIESVEITEHNTGFNDIFYYAVDKVEESNLFNWAKNTGMYTTIHGATELLGITNTFVPMIMSYWLLISVIYIIYDIALIGVHIVHNKIHDFENVM